MAAKHDAVINELNFKVDKLIKLYISSLEENKSLESKIQTLQSELESSKREAGFKQQIKNNQSGESNFRRGWKL